MPFTKRIIYLRLLKIRNAEKCSCFSQVSHRAHLFRWQLFLRLFYHLFCICLAVVLSFVLQLFAVVLHLFRDAFVETVALTEAGRDSVLSVRVTVEDRGKREQETTDVTWRPKLRKRKQL